MRTEESVEEKLKPQSPLELGFDERPTIVSTEPFFHRPPKALNDGDGAGASDGAEAMPDA